MNEQGRYFDVILSNKLCGRGSFSYPPVDFTNTVVIFTILPRKPFAADQLYGRQYSDGCSAPL